MHHGQKRLSSSSSSSLSSPSFRSPASSSSSSSSSSSQPKSKKLKSSSHDTHSDKKEVAEFKEETELSFGVDSSRVPGLAPEIRLREFQMEDAERVVRGWIHLDSGTGMSEDHFIVGAPAGKNGRQITKGVVCAHAMGLGKTLISMAALAMDMDELRQSLSSLRKPPKIQALIVLPNSVLWNWDAELDKFFPKDHPSCPFKNVLVYHSSNDTVAMPTTGKELESYDIVLTTFGTYESRFDELFYQVHWEYLVVDEAHHLRNKTTAGFRLIKKLRNNKTLLLTGTPISNKVDDLCALIDILGVEARLAKKVLLNAMKKEEKAAFDRIKGRFKKANHFVLDDDGEMDVDEKVDEKVDDKKEQGQSGGGGGGSDEKEALSKARKMVNRCVIRRRKDDVNPETGKLILQLPAKLIRNHVQLLEGADFEAYSAIESHLRMEAERLQELVKKGKMEKSDLSMAYLAILNRMRMAASHCQMVSGLNQMVPPQIVAKISSVSSKMKRAVEIVGGLLSEGKKVVIFSQWTMFLNELEKELERKLSVVHCSDSSTMLRKDIKSYARIDGKVNEHERHQQVVRFQNDVSCCIFLISLTSGAEGITLTAAHNVIICDPWWNPQKIEQAIDRIHRLGQTKDVVVRYLLSKNTVDERVHALAGEKHEMATKVLGDGVSTASKYWGKMKHLTNKDFRQLIFGGGHQKGGGGEGGGEDDHAEDDSDDDSLEDDSDREFDPVRSRNVSDDDDDDDDNSLEDDSDREFDPVRSRNVSDDDDDDDDEDGPKSVLRQSLGSQGSQDSQDDSILFENTW